MTRLPLVYAAGLLVLAAHLALSWFGPAVRGGLIATALLAVLSLICAGVGRITLKAFRLGGLSESEGTLIGCTVGLGILTQAMFLLGAAGLLKPWAVGGLLGALWVLGATETGDIVRSLYADASLLRDRPAWAAAAAALLGLVFWTAWMPPHQYDALVYHLPLPEAYLRSGSLSPVPHLVYSHFPQNGEMLFAMALALGSDLLAQLLSWLALFLAAGWVFELGKREMPIQAALLACVLLASHTAVMLLSATAYVESLAMLWLTAAVASFFRWRETAVDGGDRGWLLLSAVFAGLGVGTKYTLGVCPAILALLLAARWGASFFGEGAGPAARRARGLDLLSFAALAAALGSPWLVKNWLVAGNPVFPFLAGALPARLDGGAATAARYFGFLTEYDRPLRHFLPDLVKFPYLAAAGSLKFGGGADVLGDLGWGPLFGLLPAAVWAARRNRTIRGILVYCCLHWLAWFCTGTVLRFLVPLAPLACLAAAAGFFQCWQALSGAGRGLLAAAAAVLTAMNLGLFAYVHSLFGSWDVLVGLETRDEYLSRRLDYYPCARWARGRLDKNDRILVVGEQRGYHVEQAHVATSAMAPNHWVAWANEARGPAELAGRLRAEGGFTHVLIVPDEARRLGQYGIFAFTDEGRGTWTALESGWLKPMVKAGSCALFELSGGAARGPRPAGRPVQER